MGPQRMVSLEVARHGETRRLGRLEPATFERVTQLVGKVWPQAEAPQPAPRPAAQMWEVVGGKCRGGIVVRTGKALRSKEANDRLSRGALVEEVELDGVRLHYKLVMGPGPEEGWVSLKVAGYEQVKKTDKSLAKAMKEEREAQAEGDRVVPKGQEPLRSTPSCKSDVPICVIKRGVVTQGHSTVDVIMNWGIESVRPGVWRKGAVAFFWTSVSPWPQGGSLEIQLPAECEEVVDFWNVGVTQLTAEGLLTVKLTPYEARNFGGTLCFPSLDAPTAREKLVVSLRT